MVPEAIADYDLDQGKTCYLVSEAAMGLQRGGRLELRTPIFHSSESQKHCQPLPVANLGNSELYVQLFWCLLVCTFDCRETAHNPVWGGRRARGLTVHNVIVL